MLFLSDFVCLKPGVTEIEGPRWVLLLLICFPSSHSDQGSVILKPGAPHSRGLQGSKDYLLLFFQVISRELQQDNWILLLQAEV